MTVQQRPEVVTDVTDVIGKFGLWQKVFFTVSALVMGISAWLVFAMTFMAPDVPFRCVEYANLNFSKVINASVEEQCKTKINGTEYPCVRWVYDKSVFQTTLIEKFDLVCDNAYLISLTNSAILVGDFGGAFICGFLADRIGRRYTIWILIVATQIVNLLMLFPTNVPLFIVGRFLSGGLSFAVAQTVMLAEIVGVEYRAILNSMMWIGWAIFYSSFSGIAYLLPDWFNLQLLVTCCFAPFLVTFCLIPESPRWLIVKNRKEDAEKMILKFVQWNKLHVTNIKAHVETLHEILLKQKAQEEKVSYNFFDFLRLPKCRKRTCIVITIWMVNSFVYYGVSMNSELFGANIYLSNFLLGVIEIPAIILATIGSIYIKRRPLMMAMLFGAGISSFLVYPVQNKLLPVRITLVVLLKLCITINYTIIYVYSPETYPTGIRSSGVGLGIMMSRVSGVVAPFMKELQHAIGLGNAMALMGSVSIFVGMLTFFLPETKDVRLPETLEDSEELGMYNFTLPCREKKKEDDVALCFVNGQFRPTYGSSQILHTVPERLM